MSTKPKLERYGGSKVRTGCVTCKQRRVKCDERKPTCHRCEKAGRHCAGYASVPPKDGPAAGQPLTIISYVAPATSITLHPGIDTRERRSLEFFMKNTLLETFATPDWPEHLLRTSFYEDAIRHAVVAFGALHEHYSATGEMDEDFAMQQYSKAMRTIMKLDMTSSTSTDTALISCILFACIESLQGHYRSSLLHINSGLQILKEQESLDVADTRVAYVSKAVLRPMFLRFVTQSREFGDVDVELAYDTQPVIPRHPVTKLNTYHDAHSSMVVFLNDFVQFLGTLQRDDHSDLSILQTILDQHSQLVKRHAAWSQAFSELLQRGAGATESDIGKLQIWRTVIGMILELDISLGEMGWDKKTELFREIVRLAEVVVEQQPQGNYCASVERKVTSTHVSGPHLPVAVVQNETMSSTKPVFSLDLGVIAPLYIVISRCRDPAIRRRALQLLASCNRREGIWDSRLTARVAERIIAIEEGGAASYPVLYACQIPEHSRIRDLRTTFGVDRQGLIRYTKSVDCAGPDENYEELLEW